MARALQIYRASVSDASQLDLGEQQVDCGRNTVWVFNVRGREVFELAQLGGFLLREVRSDPDATGGLPLSVTPLALAMQLAAVLPAAVGGILAGDRWRAVKHECAGHVFFLPGLAVVTAS